MRVYPSAQISEARGSINGISWVRPRAMLPRGLTLPLGAALPWHECLLCDTHEDIDAIADDPDQDDPHDHDIG